MRLMDLAKALAEGAEIEYIGIRPGEKLHEVLIHEDEARAAVELEKALRLRPEFAPARQALERARSSGSGS
jgi:UDP-N-acetylglucosamine 4,6-dehydratase